MCMVNSMLHPKCAKKKEYKYLDNDIMISFDYSLTILCSIGICRTFARNDDLNFQRKLIAPGSYLSMKTKTYFS